MMIGCDNVFSQHLVHFLTHSKDPQIIINCNNNESVFSALKYFVHLYQADITIFSLHKAFLSYNLKVI